MDEREWCSGAGIKVTPYTGRTVDICPACGQEVPVTFDSGRVRAHLAPDQLQVA